MQCSAERLRDEFLNILGGVRPDISLRTLDTLGILPQFLPELNALKGIKQSYPHLYDVWNHILATINKLAELLYVLSSNYTPNPESGYSPNLIMGQATTRLGRYREQITKHVEALDATEVPRRALLFFAALYHDAGKPNVQTTDECNRIRFLDHEAHGVKIVNHRARAFHMSNHDVEYLKTMVAHHMRPLQLSLLPNLPTRRACYRFYRATGGSGVDVCLLSMADYLATHDFCIRQEEWFHFIDVIRILLDAWWNNPKEVISPVSLINGNDLIHIFKLQPGPQIGELIETIREAQAAGEIVTREQALDYIRQMIKKH
jgi:tRNA nucleotidyltransferase/poly(A) polymerase